jgi:chaperonin GroEL
MKDELAPKTFIFNEDVLDKLESGLKIVHDTVGATMGPGGALVMYNGIDNNNPYTSVTKDGVSVAKKVVLKDEVEDMAAQFAIQAARRQAMETGDGTTLTCILTYKIFKEARKIIAAGYHFNKVIDDMDNALLHITQSIEKMAIKDLEVSDFIRIANVALNNQPEIAKMVGEAVYKTGKYGIVEYINSKDSSHSVEYSDGYELDIGVAYKEFLNYPEKSTFIKKDVYTLITDHEIYRPELLLSVINQIQALNPGEKPHLVIISPFVSQDLIQYAIRNTIDNENGACNVVHLHPTRNLNPKDNEYVMEDLAHLTGGMFISKNSGYQIEDIKLSQLGKINSIVSLFAHKTLIVGENSADKTRIEELKEKRKLTTHPSDLELIDKSIASLSGGVAKVYVGGKNFSEREELKARVEDAIKACKSSFELGYIPGGGAALLSIKNPERSNIGSNIIYEAIKYPTEKILRNARIKSWENIIEQIKSESYPDINGYNIDNGTLQKDMGHVIDPAKVIIYGIRNAVSVAIMMLKTNVIIQTDKE